MRYLSGYHNHISDRTVTLRYMHGLWWTLDTKGSFFMLALLWWRILTILSVDSLNVGILILQICVNCFIWFIGEILNQLNYLWSESELDMTMFTPYLLPDIQWTLFVSYQRTKWDWTALLVSLINPIYLFWRPLSWRSSVTLHSCHSPSHTGEILL